MAATRAELQRELEALSSAAVQAATDQVVRLGDERRRADREAAERELTRRSGEIQRVLAPMARQLEGVERQIGELERDRRHAQGQMGQLFETMRQQVEALRGETGRLVTALRKPQVRGSWGEMQLRNCVEAADMTEHVDFVDQHTVSDDGRRLRPDLVVRMPGDASVVVDSKVPLDAYLDAVALPDGPERAACLRRHAQQLRAHLDQLASKAYHAQFERAPEFVVCFVPNDAIFGAAMEADPSLLAHGAGRRVLLATPATLMALLYAVSFGWSQERIAREARDIAALARELHKRAATFLEPLQKVGRDLGRAVDSYNAAVGSVEGRLVPQLRRIEEMGAGSEKELAAPAPVDRAARRLELAPAGDAAGPSAA
jgi:DNA recombination protein RmuC